MNLEATILLAKGAKGNAAAQLIWDSFSSPQLYFYAPLFAMAGIRELESTHPAHFKTLELFTSGTLAEYDASTMCQLTDFAHQKLLLLSLLSLCWGKRLVPYSELMQALQLSSVRQLEDLIITAFDIGLLSGKLDQKRQASLVVASCKARDVSLQQIPLLQKGLVEWHQQIEALLEQVKEKIQEVSEKVAAKELDEKEWQAKIETIQAKLQAEGFAWMLTDSRPISGPRKQR
ncbi:hypothetical protein HDV03_002021 [Kappamyces sp. JEL0829]|nr:hypothetical protein HDV03_002021 [Kappamyces sp. JEL0829]